ncbi:MAG TPA: TIGR01459 family HAD-type hydrolase, partial [Devosia sp.]|nr:TIGR01459 family HAD-type hydrolase [Devosia sp.]
AVLSDVWGVVHNGIAAHPSAVDALLRYREGGGRVVLITNAPRPSPPIVRMLDDFGVPHAAYDAIVSSGDVTRAMLVPYRGQTLHYVGPPEENNGLFEGLDITLGAPEDSRAVIVTDLDNDDETPDDYKDRVSLWLRRKLPMICANPDRVVEHGDQLVYCGGALADLYEARGGMVRMAGKPYRPIYEAALAEAEKAAGRPLDRRRILAIGDSVRTDAIGAANAGLDLLFITGSIHAGELDAFGSPDPEAIRDLVAPSGARMQAFMPRLAW